MINIRKLLNTVLDRHSFESPPNTKLSAINPELENELNTNEYLKQLQVFFDTPLRKLGLSFKSILLSKDRILDAGCGNGLLVFLLQKCGLNAYGVDITIESAKASNLKFLEPEKIIEANVASLKSKDPAFGKLGFDLVITRTLFASAFENPLIFMQDFKRDDNSPISILSDMIRGIGSVMNEGALWLLYDNRSAKLLPEDGFKAADLKIEYENRACGVMILRKLKEKAE